LSLKKDTSFKGHHSRGYIKTIEDKENEQEMHEEHTKKY